MPFLKALIFYAWGTSKSTYSQIVSSTFRSWRSGKIWWRDRLECAGRRQSRCTKKNGHIYRIFFQKARGRRVSVQAVDNPQREIRSRMEKSSSALWKYFDFSGRGAHAALKRYLQISTSNLDLVMTRMTQAVGKQAREIEAIISKERVGVPHAFRNAHCFEQLIGRVSVFALWKLDVECERSYECAENPCSHSFRNVIEIPCAHELLQLGSRPIPLSMIDRHWYLRDIDAFSEEETENTCVVSTEQSSFHIDMKTLKNPFATMEYLSTGNRRINNKGVGKWKYSCP